MVAVTGSELLAASLEDHDVDTVFNVPGFGILPFVETINRRESLSHVTSLNETALGFIAEGYSRVRREVAFLNVYQSTGTGFVMPALAVAWAERTPLIVTTTTNSRQLKGRDQYAAVPKEITDATDQYTKWSFEVPSAERIPDAIDRAVSIATSPPTGPVHLAFPMDLYEQSVESEAFDDRHGVTEIYSDGAPDSGGLQRTADAIRDAEKSVLLAGSEAGKHRANEELIDLAEQTGSGVLVEGKRSYLPFPNNHPLYLGHSTGGDYGAASAAIEEADTLIFVGFELTETLRNQYDLYDTGKTIVQIATTATDVGKQFVPDVALVGHPTRILRELNELVSERDGQRRDAIQRRFVEHHREAYRDRQEAKRDTLAKRMGGGRPTAMESIVSSLRDVYGDDLTVFHDAGDEIPFVDVADFESPEELYGISMKASVQGWAIPAGIGAQLAEPSRDVVIFEGDGGFMFTGPNALYTASKYDVPVTIVLINNRGWRAGGYNDKADVDWESEMFLGRFTDPEIDFGRLAEALGVDAFSLDDPDAARETLERAYTSEGPSLIEVQAGFRP